MSEKEVVIDWNTLNDVGVPTGLEPILPASLKRARRRSRDGELVPVCDSRDYKKDGYGRIHVNKSVCAQCL